MLAVLCVTLGAPAPLQPSAVGLHLEGRLHCVSTAVDMKSERCDTACNGRDSGLSCPSKCLCVRVPWPGAPQMVKSAKAILHRLTKGLKKLPAAHKHAQMQAARATAEHAVRMLSLEQRAESPCKSQVPGVSDESCATLCAVRASCPEVCACEDDGSKKDGHVLKIDVDVSKKPKVREWRRAGSPCSARGWPTLTLTLTLTYTLTRTGSQATTRGAGPRSRPTAQRARPSACSSPETSASKARSTALAPPRCPATTPKAASARARWTFSPVRARRTPRPRRRC